ncbi:hypothetical protein [Amycolatopsis sp.]|nr:hypothetical protein [Amycolatopsis sp.]
MPSVTGSTFCLSEQGRMAGVTMAATSHTAGEPDTLSVIVWQDS